jgi:hypothetical protein
MVPVDVTAVNGGIRPGNILFTGSDQNIILGPDGVITSK